MKITPVYTQLRTYCPSFANRVVAGFDLSSQDTSGVSQTPAVHISHLADLVSHNTTQNATSSTIRDRFEVALLLDASNPQQALDQLHDLRAELWRALVGFKPGAEYNPIQYDGGELVSLNATRLLYRLRFFAEFQLGRNLPSQPAETWHERELDGLPSLTGVTVRVDAIDPADPNLKKPGPDGRLELTFSGELKQ
ncbi:MULTISPECIES: hypothetical protein [Pseudomonas chlororaphis group]|uniref:phage tail terminator protein n=1 Tax=Pseudomonas chlororaphis group TaxID=136842 RepID=UPI002097D0E6|nr:MULTISPECIES: hypothetical protein [Pseudomonas chlororaphis group]MCO7576084.1 hypothetical protein [Pseudomonas protegens]MCO7581078.1 hypothetical protein [Pseudomonas chlororaphis]MCO7597897.1 hypothetical protein [Pseudomonas chlororaphis]